MLRYDVLCLFFNFSLLTSPHALFVSFLFLFLFFFFTFHYFFDKWAILLTFFSFLLFFRFLLLTSSLLLLLLLLSFYLFFLLIFFSSVLSVQNVASLSAAAAMAAQIPVPGADESECPICLDLMENPYRYYSIPVLTNLKFFNIRFYKNIKFFRCSFYLRFEVWCGARQKRLSSHLKLNQFKFINSVGISSNRITSHNSIQE